ncbi:type VII secretion protein EccB [Kitasatospora aureofaciens]|uniref:Type VII secretion protein EccB n=1 Tax=Kitasatospora aureofaciens TaxID=1894 RepID=A0A1E7MZ21_KITAU|nr:type VII secretion protein EccB [Kitasatospora aureofaciens]QEV01590.1 type VII secretion protein EccB [Streptomyces viridifaciens]ARF80344.1 type VII secretion protein EccB [Kitasatospora aureofaciens]OEV33682.1 type VII secretion protein EccB [Kitasatospora aureofaciens]UKZ08007.1 type VII secretion protein EccB [Streptomyces viridifaciens]GGV02257.1 type VII secretion protein EccB [Kitasatospora aureofaciens]
MASRRDELNAYTFARKRTVGAFLLPSGGGSDEDAPRPVKAVLPSVLVGAVVVAGFGLWGVFKPAAPLQWDNGKNIVQGKQSTTRYVVLTDPDGRTKRLHQVLNMSSARLVLPADAKVVVVDDGVLDRYPNHGPTIGIPYAPDKLPSKDNASRPMKWSVCDRPGSDDKQETVNQAVFVAAGPDAAALAAKDRMLGPDQLMLVQQADEQQVSTTSGQSAGGAAPVFLVDAQGRKHVIGPKSDDKERRALITAVFGPNAVPQRVKREWLDTLVNASPIVFPDVKGMTDSQGANSGVNLGNAADRRIGRLVHYQDRNYVVGKDGLFLITPFQAELIRQNPAYQVLYKYDQDKRPRSDDMTPDDQSRFNTDVKLPDTPDDWPMKSGAPVNNWQDRQDARLVVCSTYDGMSDDGRTPKRSVWAGTSYPAAYNNGAGAAYVTPGHGLFYRAVDNAAGGTQPGGNQPGAGAAGANAAAPDGSGTDFLITETGLRYSVPANGDGGHGPSPTPGASGAAKTPGPQQGTPAPGSGGQPTQNPDDQPGGNQARLGYQNVQPLPVPKEWSNLVPAGPPLTAKSAAQPQNA